jgi:hypothetical protein
MSADRIQDRISKLVRSQLPEFVKTDYEVFCSFIEAYYRFLEQDQGAQEIIQNALSYSDVDRTAASFIDYFLKNYTDNLPVSALVNKPLLIKRIRALYEAKGSDLSFKLLFKLLFNETVDVFYPYETVLKASDGVWDQPVSLRIEVVSGNPEDINNRFLTLQKNNLTYTTAIQRVKKLTDTLYEVFIGREFLAPYELNDTVTVSDSNSIIFIGVIRPTTTGYSVVYPGLNFKVGTVFNVSYGAGTGTLVRVTEIDSNGGIKKVKFLNYGYGYTDPITISLISSATSAFPLPATTAVIGSSTGGTIDSLLIQKPYSGVDPNRYFLTDYVLDDLYIADVVLAVSSVNTVTSNTTIRINEEGAEVAAITFTMGPIARYPGQYISSRGFLSESEVRLQDGGLYQPFAYRLNTSLDITKFYSIVKELLNPAGTRMFNNRILEYKANIKPSLNVSVGTTQFAIIRAGSIVTIDDNAVAARSLTLSSNTIATDNVSLQSNLEFASNVVMTFATTRQANIVAQSQATTTDSPVTIT